LVIERGLLPNNEKIVTEVVEPEPMDTSLPIKEDSFQEEQGPPKEDLNMSGKTFDGRFFTISSPMLNQSPEARLRTERLSIRKKH